MNSDPSSVSQFDIFAAEMSPSPCSTHDSELAEVAISKRRNRFITQAYPFRTRWLWNDWSCNAAII